MYMRIQTRVLIPDIDLNNFKMITNDEKLEMIKDKIKRDRKKAAAREKEIKEKLSEIASKALKFSNENYHLKGNLAKKIADCECLEREIAEHREKEKAWKTDSERMKSVIYKMHEQIQHMYRATVLPDMFLPGGKVIFPNEVMNLQADWFYTINEELYHVLDLSFLAKMNVDDQII